MSRLTCGEPFDKLRVLRRVLSEVEARAIPMFQKVFRTGNSLAVTIPVGFASSVGVRAADQVQVREAREKGRITYQFSGIQQLPLDITFLAHKKRKKKI